MQAEGYRLHTAMTVTQLIEGGTIGAEASLNKIFWSEMDVRIHELALEILGPEAERTERARRATGSTASCSRCPGPIYAGHQRDPAQHHRRPRPPAPAGRVMRFAFTDDQKLFAEGLRDLLAKECTPAHVRAVWDDGTGHDSGAVGAPGGDGRVRHARARRPPVASAATEVDLVLLLEELGRAAVPGPVLETAAVGAPGARGTPDGAGLADGRSS